jgi:hypothetical protein
MGKSGRVSSAYALKTPMMAPAIMPMTTRKMRSAQADLLAHLISAPRMKRTNSRRSSSDFVGSKSAGALSGESRMIAPSTQKGGNTERLDQKNRIVQIKYYTHKIQI